MFKIKKTKSDFSVIITLCMEGIARAALAPFVENDVKSDEATNTAIYTNKTNNTNANIK